MVDNRLKNLRGNSRRRFIKFASAVGAAVALDRSEVLNLIADSGGSAMADEAGCIGRCNSIHIVAGNGGFAWFQLLFPHTDIAKSNNETQAFHAFGQTQDATDTDKPFVFGPHTPWQTMDRTRRITAMMAGTNETHTARPTSAARVSANTSMLAASAALQSSLPSLLPVIGIEPFSAGNATGAPTVTSVSNPEGMVDLFNSAASQSILKSQADAQMYEAYYKAFLGLHRAAARPTFTRQLQITKASANFLGKNLAKLLSPTSDDLIRYGISSSSPNKLRDLAFACITSVKAFKLGLTNSVIIPAMRDDPHGAFNNMGTLAATVSGLQAILDELMLDLQATPSPTCSGQSLADTTVLTIHGDTPKTPLRRSGWPDGTPADSNWLYVYGAGYLKTGWFGGVRSNGDVRGFDPATGEDVANQSSATTASQASAAVLFAIAQGDMVAVEEHYNGGSIAGLVHEQII
jgi:hypothetical protein